MELPGGDTGLAYEATIEAALPHPPGDFLLMSGQLPTGVTLDTNTGVITGYPHEVGTFRFEIEDGKIVGIELIADQERLRADAGSSG